jgi:hypothetical protein
LFRISSSPCDWIVTLSEILNRLPEGSFRIKGEEELTERILAESVKPSRMACSPSPKLTEANRTEDTKRNIELTTMCSLTLTDVFHPHTID